MSQPFLRNVAEHLCGLYKDTPENICIVLPGKRAALFLKKELARAYKKTIWLPQIITAEELISEICGMQIPDEIDLLCDLYESYRACYGSGAESFDSFAKWGNLILQDFNEIDRYLADPRRLYDNLKDIKEIENWSLGAEILTKHQDEYLRFMASLGAIYRHFKKSLLEKNQAYQGLAYREAAEKIENNIGHLKAEKYFFCGFNALNEAELKIFKAVKQVNKAEFLWDADKYYLDDLNQEAGHFLRRNFEYLQIKEPLFIENNLSKNKQITIVSVPRQTGQAQVVKQSLRNLLEQNVPMDSVAVVLANEKLLWPVLKQIPSEVEHVNITMEYPLRYTSAYSLVELLIGVQVAYARQTRTDKYIYYRELLAVLRHPLFKTLADAKNSALRVQNCISQILHRNLSFIRTEQLKEIFSEDYDLCKELFGEHDVITLAKQLAQVISALTDELDGKTSSQSLLESEYLQIMHKQFNRLQVVLEKYPYFSDHQSFRQLFLQTAGASSAPFIGEPLKGLQVMGVLETRTLDFDHLIFVNVNEGVLPSGKTINSFIPNDLKRAFGLPLYLEKDAVYAYHFYRLLQKAKDIVLTFDSETDSFGKGEKSRFITQLQLELNQTENVKISELIATDEIKEPAEHIIEINKNEGTLANIIRKAKSNEEYGGLSPSGLIAHKECPLRFYFRYGAGLKESIQIEESAEAGTFGSILHLALENLYKDFTGKNISRDNLNLLSAKVDMEVESGFRSIFGMQIHSGKLVLQQEVIKVYVKKLIDQDLKFIARLAQAKQELQIIALEKEFTSPLPVEINGKPETIFIKGKIDRIDHYGNFTRIIDYKSSVKDSDNFRFEGSKILFEDVNRNKQLQLFIYAWLLFKNGIPAAQLQPCIIPFKVFSDEPKYILSEKQTLRFDETLLNGFENELSVYISGIFNENTSFTQTDDEKMHEYCPYNVICNL